MNNQIIGFLEIWPGRILCLLCTIFDRFLKLWKSENVNVKSTKKVVFLKFIEQGALILHHNTFVKAAEKYGKQNVYIVTFKTNEGLLDIMNAFAPDNRIILNDKNILTFAFSFFSALKKIRQENIDSVIDLEFFSCATAIFSYLSQAEKRVGYHRYEGGQNYRGDLFTHRLNYSHYISVSDSGWSMLECLSNYNPDYPAMPLMEFPKKINFLFEPSSEDIKRIQESVASNISIENVIIINPSFKDVLPLRAWPPEYYSHLLSELTNRLKDPLIIFTGKPEEYDQTQSFIKNFPFTRTINLCGKTTLRDIFTLYSLSKILITSDSGPGHFASVTDIYSIVLFGPETPVLYAPNSSKAHILYKQLPCSPCFNVYNNRISPCRNNLCLKMISVKEVADLAVTLLETTDRKVLDFI